MVRKVLVRVFSICGGFLPFVAAVAAASNRLQQLDRRSDLCASRCSIGWTLLHARL